MGLVAKVAVVMVEAVVVIRVATSVVPVDVVAGLSSKFPSLRVRLCSLTTN
jgi:hypothetical protein